MSKQRDCQQNNDLTHGKESTQPLGTPLIFPELFTGDKDFTEWIQHFRSMAVVNGWDDITRLQWMHVHVTGKANVALIPTKTESYKWAKEALQECFGPSTKKELYETRIRNHKRN